jgi:CHAT domain
MPLQQYDEFRIQIAPDMAAPAQFTLQLLETPLNQMAGPVGAPTAQFLPADLASLRNPATFNGGNLMELQRIGGAVYRAVTNPTIEAALGAAIAFSAAQQKRLRIVFSTIAVDAPQQQAIRVSELPIEVIYTAASGFYAPLLGTPVSRSLQAKPDRPTVDLTPPLRILLVAASPTGLPPADIAREAETIKAGLKDLIDSRMVVLDVCTPPTRTELNNRLRSALYHVVHFAGHGGVGRIGGDPTARAFICMEDANRDLDPLDAFTLDTMLRNCPTVKLVVVTGCSTAALPQPIAGAPFGATAFDGIAQRLVSPGSPSNVSAVVAMQFDLDNAAALAFSKSFYKTVLKPGSTIDEAVTEARAELVAALTMGSPSWANPVLYWRCQDGRPFNVLPFTSIALSPEDEKKIAIINVQIATYRSSLQDLRSQPPAVQNAAKDFRDSIVNKINEFLAQISEILGNAIRIKGGAAAVGQTLDFAVTARLRAPAKLNTVKLKIGYEDTAFEFLSTAKGANATTEPFARNAAGVLELLIDNVTGGATVGPSEIEIAIVRMRVKDGSQSTRMVTIVRLEIDAEPDVIYSKVDGYAFLQDGGAQ